MISSLLRPYPETCAQLTIDLSAFVTNWRMLSDLSNPAQCAAVVKADAYGIGLEPAVTALANAGCRTFFVAHYSEGRRARQALSECSLHADIYVLNGLREDQAPLCAAHDLRPVLGSFNEIALWQAFLAQTGWNGAAALHVDTGMNRLGLSFAEAEAFATSHWQADLNLSLLMSHFVSAEEPDNPINARQIADFERVRALFPDIPASLPNSSGIFLKTLKQDIVRPGFALYGGNPCPGKPNPMRPVVTLQAPIIQTRAIKAGQSVGYNAQWVAKRDTRLATVGIGYADGFPRAAMTSGRHDGAQALVAGHRCNLAGRVSMDLIVLDVTDVPERDVQPGVMAEFLGATITIDELAARTSTIGYEILTGLGRRYARQYRQG